MLSQNTSTAIKILSYIVRIVVGLVLGLYLGCLLFTASPPAQRWMARKASDILSQELQTEVCIGNIRLGLFNRMVINDVLLRDQCSDTLLYATRLSAKVHVPSLLTPRLCIRHVQLFGFDIRLKRDSMQAPYNFQFIIDRLASNDTTQTAINLTIPAITIRRGTLTHDILSEPQTDRFNPAHVRLEDLGLRASIEKITQDSIYAVVNQLKIVDARSGLMLDDLKFGLEVLLPHTSDTCASHPLTARLFDVRLALPHSELHVPSAYVELRDSSLCKAGALLQGDITPSDLAPLYPPLASFSDGVNLDVEGLWTEGTLRLDKCSLSSNPLQFDATGSVNAGTRALFDKDTHADINIHHLNVDSAFTRQVADHLVEANVVQPELSKMFARIGSIALTGQAAYANTLTTADMQLTTSLGNAHLNGQLANGNDFDLHLQTEDIRLAQLLPPEKDFPLNHLTLKADARGSISAKTADVQLDARNLLLRDEQLDHLQVDVSLTPRNWKAQAQLMDPQYAFRLQADLNSLTDIVPDSTLPDRLQGHLLLNDLRIRTPQHHYDLDRLRLSVLNNETGRHIDAGGDFMDARIDGHFTYTDLIRSAQQMLHRTLPSLIPAAPPTKDNCTAHFSVQFSNADSLLAMADVPLRLPETAYLQGNIDTHSNVLTLHADLPHVIYGSQELRSVSLIAREQKDSLNLYAEMQRMTDEAPITLQLNAGSARDRLQTDLTWDDHRRPALRGALRTLTHFEKSTQGGLGAHLSMQPSQIIVADTIWNLHAADITLSGGAVDVNGFRITQMGRYLQIDGRASRSPADTLWADLKGINLEYVFGLIDFDDVNFAGSATGRLAAHNLMESPTVDAQLNVDNFTLNGGLLGQLYLTGGFGRKDDRAIDLDALIQEPIRQQISHVTALIKPGHEPGRGMELDIQARHINTYFINEFTSSIFTDLQGRATGHAFLHGPFKQLDLEGDLAIDTLAVTVNALGTRYHLAGGDSLHLRPEGIFMRNITLLDSHHGHDKRQHSADLNGEVRFRHFKNLSYDFNITAHDFLGYDFHDFGDQTFYGTVFANGNIHLNGREGQLNVDLNCRPTTGTVFTYNVSTPETLTDNQFITFKKTADTSSTNPLDSPSGESPPVDSLPALPNGREQLLWSVEESASIKGEYPLPSGTEGGESGESDDPSSDEPIDIRINFDLDITPDATMRLLMDPRSGDYITLNGNANIKANFYNKGRFQMYGLYRVDHGTYKLSVQDVLRKDFIFERGSTITFGGTPLKADLNLRAIHTVPSVQLNALSAGSNFANSTVRVNCIMAIGGQAEHPQITFDFDIPNINEDMKRMIRSMLATEEERNMQVIYLLGIGRFYTYGLDADQSQTNSAMNSLLSSTLSGQINNLLSNAIKTNNWNFGTSLSTGNMGWSDMDVEGTLSGRLFKNRLLINGTFGYHDTPVANTNFIGDFDVQYLITPTGTVSLKAYSETNDRYFTKSALTTQGIGIQLRKDFNSLSDLFKRRK